MILYGRRYGLITFLSMSKSQCDSNRNEIHLSSSHVRGKISMQATRIRTKQNRDGACTRVRSPACRIKAQQTSNTSSHAKQHTEACPPRRNPSPCKSTNRSTLGSRESSHSRAESRREAQLHRWQSRKTREWRKGEKSEGLMGKKD